MKSCPTAAIEAVLDLSSLHIAIKGITKITSTRMTEEGTIRQLSSPNLTKLIEPDSNRKTYQKENQFIKEFVTKLSNKSK